MSSSSSSSMKQPEEPPDLLLCGQCGDRPKKGETFKTCSGCSFVAYCSAACQLAAWPDHKGFCKEKKKAKAKSKEAAAAAAAGKAKAPVSSSGCGTGSDLEEMGSIMAALNKRQSQPLPQPLPQRYWDGSAWNACFYGHHEELRKILLQRGISVNWAQPETGMTAAYAAAQEGHAQCLSLLAQHGAAYLSKVSKNGWAPIHRACECDRYDCLEVLLDNHVDANLRVANALGNTPAILASQNGHVKLLALLLDRGSDPNISNSDGTTAAYIAAQEGHAQCLSLLAQHGSADLSKAAKDGWVPIHAACQQGRYDCLKVLLENHVDANLRAADEQGDTPVMIATSNGHVKLLALLLDRGSDPNLSDSVGTTATHRACQYGQLKCLQLLRERNAELNTQDADGHTPLDFARMFKQPECVDLLLACGCIGMNKEDLDVISEAFKESDANFAKEAKDRQRQARRCDLPACQATAADLELGERFKKCPACRVAIYCCKDHAVQHYPEHESLCAELTRICDYPRCKEGADIDIMCRQCKVATYCSKKHRTKHSSAHESRCEELCEWR